MEVLRDECVEREERWVAVEVNGDGTGFMGAFGEKGGMGLKRERKIHGQGGGMGMGIDVGSVAKIWGFGGRRV